jgi:O-acetylserine/cysteine efflux transporter
MKGRHVLLTVLITAIWGFNFSVIKIGLATVDPLVLAGIRFTLCALPAVLFLRKPDVPWRYLAGYGLFFGVGLWGVVNLGIKAGLSSGIASLVLQFSAFITIALGAVVFRERISRNQYLGIGIALLGLVCIILVTDGTVVAVGVALVLLGAVSWSVANILLKKAAPREMLAFLVWSSVFSPIPLFALAYVTTGTAGFVGLVDGLDTAAVLSILFQAYPNTVFAYWMWNRMLGMYPVSTVAPMSLLVPIFGFAGSVLIFDERLSALKLLAVALIVAGLAVGLYGHRLGALLSSLRRPEVSLEGGE